jgi:hypothetical protein
MAHHDREMPQWLTRHPADPRRRSVAEWARFGVLRHRLLRQCLRDPSLWLLQGRTVLRVLARYALYLGLFLVLAPPILGFWEAVMWPADSAAAAPDGILMRWLHRGLLWLLGLVLVDLLLGCRLSRFRNIFVATAERLAWAVVDEEFSAAGGTGPRRPDAAAQDTTSAP